MALLSIFRGTQAECSARPVSDGTLLFATDTKKIYLDKDSSRIEMSSVDDLGNYVTKEQLTTALNGKASTTHTHTQDQITGLKDALAGKASTSHSHSAASSSMSGFMSAADKQKLDGIAAGANKYTLPAASSTALGGVKVGKNLTIAEDGTLSADEQITVIDSKDIDESTFYDVVKEKWPQIIVRKGNYTLWPQAYLNDRLTPYTYDTYLFSNLACNLNEELGSTISGYVEGLLVMKGDILWANTALLSREQLNWDYLKNRPFTYIGNGLRVDSFFGELVLSVTNYSDLATNSSVASAVNAMGSTKADASHTHSTSDITDFPTLATVATSGSYSDLNDKPTSMPASDVKAWAKADTKPSYGFSEITGSLDVSKLSGIIDSSHLPSYVDDVVEYTSSSTFPTEGEAGKIYVDLTTNKIYRWSGSAYVVISETIALGETSSSAYRGDRGKIAYDHSQVTSGNPHKVTKSDVGLGNVDNTADSIKSVKHATSADSASTATSATKAIQDSAGQQINTTYINKVNKSGDTMAGRLTAPEVAATNYFVTPTIVGEGDDTKYLHRIDFGYVSHDHVDFYEYGGTWNFYKNRDMKGAKDTRILVASIQPDGFHGDVKGQAESAITAKRLSTSAGSATQPIYFLDGKPVATTYTLGKSVPSNAVFTDTNTWIALKGATTNAAGTAGYAPAPAAGAANRYLRSDGTWTVPPDTNTNTTYTLTKSGSTITLNGSDGSTTSVTDANTTYSLSSFGVTATAAELNYMDGVTSNVQTQLNGKAASSHSHSTATTSAAGFLRQLNGSTSNFLRGDGTWATPTATIADGSVTTAKLATDAVTAAKIATNAVTADGIAAEAVGTSELASNAVTLDKLGSDVGTVAVQSSEPSDPNVKLWIQI